MATKDRLLRLITRLQNEVSMPRARYLLLRYMREISDAQRVALFVLDKTENTLVLLAQSRGHMSASSKDNTPVPTAKHISLDGLLGSTLLTQGPLSIADLYADPRTLPEECAWGWPGGLAILSAVNGARPSGEQGVLLLCFAPAHPHKTIEEGRSEHHAIIEHGSDLLICITLLSTYLSRTEQWTGVVENASPRTRRLTSARSPRYDVFKQQLLPEMIYTLSELYEIGLVIGTNVEVHELYQHLLTHLRLVADAPSGCLLLYHLKQHQFSVAATQGNELPCTMLMASLDSATMEKLAMRGPGETLTTASIDGQHVLLVTLSCNCMLLGVVVLSTANVTELVDERRLLITSMGHVAALILRNYDLHVSQQKEAINYERGRIARDLHDGVAQQIVYVLHKLEFIQYLLEKQPTRSEAALSEVKKAVSGLVTSLNDLRHGISSLLPAQLAERSFADALQDLFNEYMSSTYGLEIFCTRDELERLPSTLEVASFRLIQEALNNVRKHAFATRVFVRIRVLPDLLMVEINDNGIGFQTDQVANATGDTDNIQHIGLRTMRERVQEMGGQWEIQSKPGEGTTVKARFPLETSEIILTGREQEVLRLVVEGLTNRAIARQLSISTETVKSHVHHIMRKMRVRDRTQAAVVATRQGWI